MKSNLFSMQIFFIVVIIQGPFVAAIRTIRSNLKFANHLSIQFSFALHTYMRKKKKLRGSIFDCVNNFVNIFCTIIVLFFIIIFIDAIINFLSCFSSIRSYKINLISTKMSCWVVLHTRHICKTKEINLILFNLNSVEWGHILQGEFWWCLDAAAPSNNNYRRNNCCCYECDMDGCRF